MRIKSPVKHLERYSLRRIEPLLSMEQTVAAYRLQHVGYFCVPSDKQVKRTKHLLRSSVRGDLLGPKANVLDLQGVLVVETSGDDVHLTAVEVAACLIDDESSLGA